MPGPSSSSHDLRKASHLIIMSLGSMLSVGLGHPTPLVPTQWGSGVILGLRIASNNTSPALQVIFYNTRQVKPNTAIVKIHRAKRNRRVVVSAAEISLQ